MHRGPPPEAPARASALLDVHLMLLHDEALHRRRQALDQRAALQRRVGAAPQLEVLARQFDDMEDEYLRERKADLSRWPSACCALAGGADGASQRRVATQPTCARTMDPLVLVAHDLSPADMLQFSSSVFAGFVTDVGGTTSHTAIVARSMDIPAVVGARSASQLIRQDDWLDHRRRRRRGDRRPAAIMLAEYGFKQSQGEIERGRLSRLRHTPALTLDGAADRAAGQHRAAGATRAAARRPAPPASACSAANSCS